MPHKKSGPTRMVVDSNALQSPMLRDYLCLISANR